MERAASVVGVSLVDLRIASVVDGAEVLWARGYRVVLALLSGSREAPSAPGSLVGGGVGLLLLVVWIRHIRANRRDVVRVLLATDHRVPNGAFRRLRARSAGDHTDIVE